MARDLKGTVPAEPGEAVTAAAGVQASRLRHTAKPGRKLSLVLKRRPKVRTMTGHSLNLKRSAPRKPGVSHGPNAPAAKERPVRRAKARLVLADGAVAAAPGAVELVTTVQAGVQKAQEPTKAPRVSKARVRAGVSVALAANAPRAAVAEAPERKADHATVNGAEGLAADGAASAAIVRSNKVADHHRKVAGNGPSASTTSLRPKHL